MATIAEMIVKIGADVGQATSAIKGFASDANASFKQAEAGSQALAAGIGVIGAGIAAFAVSSVKSLAEAQQAMAQTEAVIKSTGGAANVSAEQISNLANSLEAMTGIDDVAIQKGENLLLTFTNIKNGVGAGNDVFTQATKIMVDMSVAMGTDAAGGAIQLGKALNDPKAGITALTRVGVTFTEEQKKQIEALQASGKTMEAQKIILAELNKEFGGSAAALGATFTGSLNRAQAALEDVGKAIFKDVLPPLTKLTNEAVNELVQAADKIEAIGFRDTLESWIGPSEKVRLAITMVAGGITAALIPAAYGAATAFIAAAAPLAPFVAAGAGVVALGYGIYKAWQNLPNMLEAIGAGWNLAKSVVVGAVSALDLKVKQGFAAITGYVSSMVTSVQTWLGQKLSAALNLVTHPIEAAKKAFFGLYDAVVGHSYIPDMVKETGQHMATLDKHLVAHAEKHTKAAKSAFQKMRDDIAGVMADMVSKIGEASVEFKVTGDSAALLQSKIDATRDALRGLFKKGFDESAGSVQAMREQLRLLTDEQNANKTALENLQPYQAFAESIRGISIQEQLWGTSQDAIAQKVTATETAMAALADKFGPASAEVEAMRGQWQAFNDELTNQAASDAVDKVLGGIATKAPDATKALEGMTPMIKGINEALGTTEITSGHVQSALGALTSSFTNWSKSVYDDLVKTGKMAKDEADRLQSRVTDSMSALDAVMGAMARGDMMGTAVAMVFHGVKAIWNMFSDLIKGIGGFFEWVGSGFQSKPPEVAAVSTAAPPPPPSGFGTKSTAMDTAGAGGGGQIVINITGNTMMGDQDGERLGRLLVDTLRRQGVRFA